jgi:hypothetical protein
VISTKPLASGAENPSEVSRLAGASASAPEADPQDRSFQTHRRQPAGARSRRRGYAAAPAASGHYHPAGMRQPATEPLHPPRAFARMEPSPGERFEIEWCHFGALNYAGDNRKLYAFCLVEGHSRMLYVELTHCQSFETFVRCLHAFQVLGGVARECWYDNLLKVVAGARSTSAPWFASIDSSSASPASVASAPELAIERPAGRRVRWNAEASVMSAKTSGHLREFTGLSDVNRPGAGVAERNRQPAPAP